MKYNYSLKPYPNGYDFSQNEFISRTEDSEFFSTSLNRFGIWCNWKLEDENQAFREIWINRIKNA